MSNLVNPNELIEVSDDSKDPKIRLLICNTCISIDPLPYYEGHPDRDETLMARVAEHQYPGPQPTRGHALALCTISERTWEDKAKRASVLAEMKNKMGIGAGQGEGLGQELYDVRNTYAEDAMRCWRFEHGRTSNCDDYMSSSKLLLADSRGERKELGLDPKDRARISLCQFCPYHSVVQQRKNKARGL